MRFGIVVLACPIPLSDEQREQLMLAAIQAFHEDSRKTWLDWEELRGWLEAMPETVSLGGLTGKLFQAEIHTNEGNSGQLRFLVAEQELELMQGGPVAEA